MEIKAKSLKGIDYFYMVTMNEKSSLKNRLEEKIILYQDNDIRYWENEMVRCPNYISRFGLISSRIHKRMWETFFHPVKAIKGEVRQYRNVISHESRYQK